MRGQTLKVGKKEDKHAGSVWKRSQLNRAEGSRGDAPCGVQRRRLWWGLGQRPNCSTGDHFAKRAQQRRRQRSVPASNFAHPQMRPPSCSIYHSHIVAPDGRDRVAGLSVIAAFSRKQGILPLRRRVGGNENRRMSAVAPDTPSQRTPMFLDFFRKLFILFPDSPAPSACAFSLLASAHST